MATTPPAASPTPRPLRRFGCALVLCVHAAACYAPGSPAAPERDTAEPVDLSVADSGADIGSDGHDADALGPDVVSPAVELPIVATRLVPGEVRWVAAAGVGATLFFGPDGWRWLDGAGDRAVSPPEATLPADAAGVVTALLGEGDLLVGHSAGLIRIKDGVVVDAPLATRFDGVRVTGLASTADTLWIASAEGLHAYTGGNLVPWTSPPHDLAANLLAVGPRPVLPAGAPSSPAFGVWLAGAHGSSALWPNASAPVLSLEAPALTAPPVSALAASADGLVGVLFAGTLHVRVQASPHVDWVSPIAAPVLAIAALPDSAGLWCLLEGGALHRISAAGTEVAVGVPAAIAGAASLAARPSGALLVPTPEGLFELSARRTVSVGGLAAGDRVVAPVRLTLRLPDPGLVAEVTARVGLAEGPSEPLDVDVEGEGGARSFSVLLDPYTLANGAYTLGVDVAWSGGDVAAANVPFEVRFPTWGGDIRGIFERSCANCHGRGNGGNFASLDGPDAWSSRLDDILCRVDVHGESRAPECATFPRLPSTMPPGGVLPATDAAALRMWRAAGFRP